jgi:hypothetical protein
MFEASFLMPEAPVDATETPPSGGFDREVLTVGG